MSATALTTETSAAVQTAPTAKQAELATKRAEARTAKAEAKAAKAAATAANRANGIIGTLYAALCTTTGTTKSEILTELVAKFPDRDRDGMAVTVGIQLSRLAKQASPKHPEEFPNGRPVTSTTAFAGRARVYGFTDVIILPEVAVPVITTEPAAPAEPVATAEVAPVEMTKAERKAAAKAAKAAA